MTLRRQSGHGNFGRWVQVREHVHLLSIVKACLQAAQLYPPRILYIPLNLPLRIGFHNDHRGGLVAGGAQLSLLRNRCILLNRLNRIAFDDEHQSKLVASDRWALAHIGGHRDGIDQSHDGPSNDEKHDGHRGDLKSLQRSKKLDHGAHTSQLVHACCPN